MSYEQTGAHLCEFTIKVVSQPGQKPDDLFREVSNAVQKICGSAASLSRPPDHEESGVHMTTSPLYRLNMEERS